MLKMYQNDVYQTHIVMLHHKSGYWKNILISLSQARLREELCIIKKQYGNELYQTIYIDKLQQ